MNEPIHDAPSPGNNFLIRLVLGLLLLLPAVMVYRDVQLLPALQTIEMSQQDVNILRPDGNEFIGSVNYTELLSDVPFMQAVAYTGLMIAVRLLIVAVIPPLIGALVGGQGQGGRLFNRFFMAIIGVLISPVVLAVLWALIGSQVWGREPSPLSPPPEWMFLGSPQGARTSVIFVDALVTMGIAAVVGGAAFIAARRGKALGVSTQRASIGVWLIGLFATAASLAHTFEIPFILTAGGPARSTTTLGLYIYDLSFRRFQMGPAAAQAVLMILFAVVLACLIWLVITGLRLRLMPISTRQSRQDESDRDSSTASIISIPLLILIGLTSAALIIWGLWLAQRTDGLSDASEQIDIGRSFLNTVSGPWTAIWLIQIPVTYLAALSLGFLKPISRTASHVLFLILLIVAFIPAESLFTSWYIIGRDSGTFNTPTMVGFAWRVGAFSLIVFKLFFEGSLERFNAARLQGHTVNDAFIKTVFLPSLPIVILVGAALSFASTQSLMWPLLAVNDPELMSLPVQLVMARNAYVTEHGVLAGAAVSFIGLVMLIFLPIFLFLQAFVLDQLAIVGGPDIDPEILASGKQKMKREELDL